MQKFINSIDKWQQRHSIIGFPYAVIKKYGEDGAGYQAALLTYYGFLSLFPLLMVLTTITDNLGRSDPEVDQAIIDGVTSYFPVLGDQLAQSIHSLQGNSLALIVGILFTLYGTRGVADVFQRGMQQVWGINKLKLDGFPKGMLKSLTIILIGGFGFVFAAITSSVAASSGHGWASWVLSIGINLFVLFWLFIYLLNVSLPKKVSFKNLWIGAVAASVGLVILQALGGYILAHELKSLNALYSYFALTLGLMFWIYLQAQMVYYSAEIATVSSKKLWPRSFSDEE